MEQKAKPVRVAGKALTEEWGRCLSLAITAQCWAVGEQKNGNLVIKRTGRYIGYVLPPGDRMHEALRKDQDENKFTDEMINRLGVALATHYKDEECLN